MGKKVSQDTIEKIETWMDLKNRALRLFAETQFDFLLKESELEHHELTIGFIKKR